MARFGTRLRLAWLRGVEALGTSASNMASNAQFKVMEVNMESRRREIMTEFNLKAFELWQKGVELPPALDALFVELTDLDGKLNDLRAQRYAKVNGGAADGQTAPDSAPAEDAPAEMQTSADVPPALEAPSVEMQSDELAAQEPPEGESVSE